MKTFFSKILRFAAFSASTLVGTGVDTLVLWLCSHLWLTSAIGETLISPMISFECAVVANFLVSYYLVWRDRITQRKSSRSFFIHFAAYNASCIAGFLVKMFFLLCVKYISISRGGDLDVVWCNLIALAFSGIFNFVMNEMVVFRKKKDSPTKGEEAIFPTEEDDAIAEDDAAAEETVSCEKESPAATSAATPQDSPSQDSAK